MNSFTILLATTIIATTCPEGGIPASDMNAALERAMTDQKILANTQQFSDAIDAARAQLPCLSTTIAEAYAVRFHIATGLSAFAAGDKEQALLSFRAAVKIDENAKLPPLVGRPGTPLGNLFEQAKYSPSTGEPVGAATGEATLVDGKRRPARPVELPTILQRIGEEGKVLETVYLLPGEPLPQWALPRAPELEQSHSFARPRSAKPYFIASGVLTGVALASYGANILVNNQFEDPETPTSDFASLQKQSIATTIVSSAAGAAAVGTGGFGIYLTIRW